MDTLEHRIQHRLQLGQFEAERLTAYLHTLPADAWYHPSACEAWEVRDVLGHLTLFAEFYADTIARGVQATVAMVESASTGRAVKIAPLTVE
jgi:uncharacterized damage-inducible protein DinB